MIDNRLSEKLALILSSSSGMDLRGGVVYENNENKIVLFPKGIHPTKGFKIFLHPGWKTIHGLFVPGNLAKELLVGMRYVSQHNKSLFVKLAQYILENGGSLVLSINGNAVSVVEPNTWPDHWSYIEIHFKSKPVESDLDLRIDPDLFSHLLKWSNLFLSLVMSLLPLEDSEGHHLDQIGTVEGVKSEYTGDRYERNRVNRMICISVHGTVCKACGFDFGLVYGEIGESFIHVHHITPLSQAGAEGRIFNPIHDLLPVCPNCHAMIHKRTPPYSLDEIRLLIRNNKKEK